jgi:hypothetical protein
VNVGENVETPFGPARVVAFQAHETWVFGRCRRDVWVVVELDDGRRRVVRPAEVTAGEGRQEGDAP